MGSVTATDLLATLTEQDGTLKSQLRAIAKLDAVREVSSAVAAREERRVNNRQAKEQMDRANRVVAYHARQEFLDFSKEIDEKKGGSVHTSTASLIQRVIPRTEIEKSILEAVGHSNSTCSQSDMAKSYPIARVVVSCYFKHNEPVHWQLCKPVLLLLPLSLDPAQ